MRVGVVIPSTATPETRCRTAAAADTIGLDLVHVEGSDKSDPLILAAALAHHTQCVRIMAELTAGMHPLALAERLFITDQTLGGRLVVVLRSPGDPDVLAETVEVVLQASTGRPVRFDGAHWKVPANEGDHLTVTPGPAQLRLPLWLSGPGAEGVAASFGLPLLGSDAEAGRLASWWGDAERHWGRMHLDLPRPMTAVLDADEPHELAGVAARLRTHRRAWGLDTVVFRTGDLGTAGLGVLAALRARLQLDVLPAGIEQFWADTWPLDPLTDL